jgi:hypothetical protein
MLRGVVVLAVVLSVVFATVVGGPVGPFTLPVLVQAVVLLVGIEVSRASRTGLRVDALTLFLGWEALRGCIAPVIIQWFGSGSNFFWRPGTHADATLVLFIGVAFAAAVVLTRAVCGVLGRRRGQADPADVVRVAELVNGPIAPAVLIVLGLVGLVLRFPDVGSVTSFLSGDIDGLTGNDIVPKGPLTFIGMVIRPLLVLGLAMLARKRHQEGRRIWWVFLFLAGAVVFALGSYGLNRAAIVFAVIALVLVLVDRSRRRIGLASSLLAVGLLGVFFFAAGTLRSTLWLDRTGLDAPEVGIVPALQSVLVYAASPMQLSGAMPWAEETGAFGGETFVKSLLGPVPGIPDVWREQSGVALFNHAVYHSYIGRDQLLPTWFEGFLSFGLPGVLGVALVMGILLFVSDRMRTRLGSFPAAYGAALVALWVSQPSAVGSYSILQNAIYFALPPLILAAVTSRSRRPSNRAAAVPPTTSERLAS